MQQTGHGQKALGIVRAAPSVGLSSVQMHVHWGGVPSDQAIRRQHTSFDGFAGCITRATQIMPLSGKIGRAPCNLPARGARHLIEAPAAEHGCTLLSSSAKVRKYVYLRCVVTAHARLRSPLSEGRDRMGRKTRRIALLWRQGLRRPYRQGSAPPSAYPVIPEYHGRLNSVL